MSAFTPINVIFVVALAASIALPFFSGKGKFAVPAFLFAVFVGTLPTNKGALTLAANAAIWGVILVVAGITLWYLNRNKASEGDRKAAEEAKEKAVEKAEEANVANDEAEEAKDKAEVAKEKAVEAKDKAEAAAQAVEGFADSIARMFTADLTSANKSAILATLITEFVVGGTHAGFATAVPATNAISTGGVNDKGLLRAAMVVVNAPATAAGNPPVVTEASSIQDLLNALNNIP